MKVEREEMGLTEPRYDREYGVLSIDEQEQVVGPRMMKEKRKRERSGRKCNRGW